MQITIDTKNDSMEEIRMVASLLNHVLGKKSGRREGLYSNIPNDIIQSPFDQRQQSNSNGYVDFFEKKETSACNPYQQSSSYPQQSAQQYSGYPQQQPASQPSSIFSLFDSNDQSQPQQSTADQYYPPKQEKPEEIQIIAY